MIAYILAHWVALWSNRSSKPDWGQAALLAAENLFPLPVLSALIIKIRRLQGLSPSKRFGASNSGMAVRLIENGARSQFQTTLVMSQGINSLAFGT
ncbi:MAG: hypothetical protein N5P05_000028 [Chroococcopsis gigantea SAG 12.99]|nr:hypothetical protein [Chroococcopsis gigantea SAG 12.99]